MAKSNAERQREYRDRQAAKGLKPFYVKGENGYFDPRLRFAAAVQYLASAGALPPDVRANLIAAARMLPPPHNLIDEKFITKELEAYLEEGNNGK